MLHQHLLTSLHLPCIVDFVKEVLVVAFLILYIVALVFASNSKRPESCESGADGSTPGSRSGGREFDPRLSLAQMVEW